jgi:hypothetical protein
VALNRFKHFSKKIWRMKSMVDVSGFKKAQVSGDEDKNPSISCKLFLCQSEAPKNNRGCVLILVFEGAIRRMSRCGKKSPPIKPARHRPNLQVTSDAMPHTVHCACAESVFHEQSALSISLAILEAIDGAHLPIFPLRPLPKTSLYLSPLRSRTNLLCGWVRQNCSKPVSTGSRPPLSTKPSGPF